MVKNNLKRLLSECHWPAESNLYNLIKNKGSDFYLTNAKIAIQSAEESNSPTEREFQLIYAIRLLNMARASIPTNIKLVLPPIEEREKQQIDEEIISNRGD